MASDSDSGSEFSLMDEDEYAAQQPSSAHKDAADHDDAELAQEAEEEQAPLTSQMHVVEDMPAADEDDAGKEIQQLEQQASRVPIGADQYQYDAHVRLIELLRSGQRVDKLYERALQDYLSVALWHDRIARIVPEFDRRLEASDEALDVEAGFIADVRTQLFGPALERVMHHVAESAIVWDLIMNMEVSILKKSTSPSQFQRIQTMFYERLTIAHAGLEETFSRLSPLVTEHCNELYESIMVEASHKKQLGDKAYAVRAPLEAQLMAASYSQQAFDAYIAAEKQQRPPSPAYIATVYERALAYHCLNPLLWEQYLLYMDGGR
ncbi:hypothetical protein SYNPS1DRAFT_23988 [Syncephalis pseudoplumigaleata]|uniref:Uncharacterized protein n=1 Tax=Syncephalis pseudoplumigaleata TaxID=1712513 RepID=A0A4P9YWQ1_9FUNG|nr:hypothetical protein SYNPS1DRAFT_23988 [Syncephalis pseudoplumigaleata]|eukprot:RKP23922.1 hypothetical protein SYNPS1DRAFT_23988 [Syncephalis pseudoplumigaleata]